MGYIETIRELAGNTSLILVRPSVIVINARGEILLVRYQDEIWGIPGGMMELGETVEECAAREVKEETGLTVKNLQLFGVFSGKELYTRLNNGHEYYNIVIGYLCTNYEGDIQPDLDEVLEAKFFPLHQLPDQLPPYIQSKVSEYAAKIGEMLKQNR